MCLFCLFFVVVFVCLFGFFVLFCFFLFFFCFVLFCFALRQGFSQDLELTDSAGVAAWEA